MLEEMEVLKEVATRLNEAGIPYMISGSVAMNYYAEPRMTRDIDIVIILGKSDVNRFVSLFENDYYLDKETVKSEVDRKGMFNLINNKFILKIDFILLKDGIADRTGFERRKEVSVDGFKVWMISPEDLVIQKLLWAKESVSEMQLKDVGNIVRMVSDMDTGYLNKWLSQFGLKENFNKAVKFKS